MTSQDQAPATVLARALVSLDLLDEQARAYVDEAVAANTRRAYRADWEAFTAWCALHAVPALPTEPSTLVLYLTDQAAVLKTSTLQRRLAAIAQAHRLAGHPSPTEDITVRTVWRGIRRTKGTAQAAKQALLVHELRALLGVLPISPLGVRDRALLLLGFAGAFRRSELVALDVADLVVGPDGVTVTIRRSKTDQEGVGQRVGIPYGRHRDTCPVLALTTWLELAQFTSGPIFRPITRHGAILPTRLSDRAVARIVQRVAAAAGLDPARYAGHSLRAGLATSAALAGAEERDIMRQTRHQSLTVARRYIRAGSLFRNNAAATVGL